MDTNTVVPVLIGGILVPIGASMGQIRPKGFIAIRPIPTKFLQL